jgi:hypothetical protein
MMITANLVVSCVTGERKNIAGKDMASVAGRLPLYPLDMIEEVLVLRVFARCGLVIAS